MIKAIDNINKLNVTTDSKKDKHIDSKDKQKKNQSNNANEFQEILKNELTNKNISCIIDS